MTAYTALLIAWILLVIGYIIEIAMTVKYKILSNDLMKAIDSHMDALFEIDELKHKYDSMITEIKKENE